MLFQREISIRSTRPFAWTAALVPMSALWEPSRLKHNFRMYYSGALSPAQTAEGTGVMPGPFSVSSVLSGVVLLLLINN